MKCTIKNIDERIGEWKNPKSGADNRFIRGTFDDGRRWNFMTTADALDKRLTEFKALVGKEGEFVLQERTDNRGDVEFSIKSYPGKENSGGGWAGKKEYAQAYRNTQEGQRSEQSSIHRSVAAAETFKLVVSGHLNFDDWRSFADKVYDWLNHENARSVAEEHLTVWTSKLNECMDKKLFQDILNNPAFKSFKVALSKRGYSDLLEQIDRVAHENEDRIHSQKAA